MKKGFLSTPKFWGIVFFGIIPVFALFYTLLPDSWFIYANDQYHLSNFWTALYFSTITITTLGFGDIYPISIGAKIFVIIESLLGLLSIGLFLNAVALKRSRLDGKAEKERAETDRRKAEEIRLLRQYVVINPHLEEYLRFATIVSTPIVKRKGVYEYNPEFPFQDLYDLYSPSLQLRDNFLKPVIVHFYRALHALESRLETTLQTVDFSIWPDIEIQITTVIRAFRTYDFESAIIGNIQMSLDGKKATDVDRDMIKTWSDKIDFHPSNAINKYVSLYFMIKQTMPPLINLRDHIQKLTNNESI